MPKKDQQRERISGEERKAKIIDTALTLFAEKGFAATRTHEIAEAAGISGTLIFQHFKTKKELIRAALAVLFHRHPINNELKTSLEEASDDAGFFRAIALHLIKHNQEDPRILKLAIHSSLEGINFGELTHVDETPMLGLIVEHIRKRIDEGTFVKTNTEIAARLFVETVYMYITDQAASISGSPMPFSDNEVVETLVSIYLSGFLKR